MGEMINGYEILTGKPQERKAFGRPRSRLDDNTKTELRKIRLKVWIGLI
jgi:hypothetical protein